MSSSDYHVLLRILAINPPSVIFKEVGKLGIKLKEEDNFGWVYKNNDLSERKHRQKIFIEFLKEIGLYNENIGIEGDRGHCCYLPKIGFIKKRVIITKFSRYLYAKSRVNL